MSFPDPDYQEFAATAQSINGQRHYMIAHSSQQPSKQNSHESHVDAHSGASYVVPGTQLETAFLGAAGGASSEDDIFEDAVENLGGFESNGWGTNFGQPTFDDKLTEGIEGETDNEVSTFEQIFRKFAQKSDEEERSNLGGAYGSTDESVSEVEGAGIDKAHCNSVRYYRPATPPAPIGIKPEDARAALKNSSASKVQPFHQEEGRLRPGPDVDRDRSRSLNAHFRFHERVANLIPRLPNHELFDWARRYWIAVLIGGKQPKNAHNEKDFIWMKGNKFSTVATVFHAYANATMVDKDDLVLMLGNERVEMMDQMQALDFFTDRLVVMRASSKSNPDSQGKSLVEGVELVTIDLTKD